MLHILKVTCNAILRLYLPGMFMVWLVFYQVICTVFVWKVLTSFLKFKKKKGKTKKPQSWLEISHHFGMSLTLSHVKTTDRIGSVRLVIRKTSDRLYLYWKSATHVLWKRRRNSLSQIPHLPSESFYCWTAGLGQDLSASWLWFKDS